MEKLPDSITIGDKYDPAMKVKNKKEAKEYLEILIEHNMRVSGRNRKEAKQIELRNLGYYSGYYDQKTMNRVKKVFGAQHPIFG